MSPSQMQPLSRRAAMEQDLFRQDVVAGLQAAPKRLPCKYFYDKRGSELFDLICELDEYYLSRTELAIMDRYAAEMGAAIGPGVCLVEFGSGSSVKTRILLDHLPEPVAYVPCDISREHLLKTAQSLAADYPRIEILPVCVDFTQEFVVPRSNRPSTHTAVYFPGSTIGNFLPSQAAKLLKQIGKLSDRGGGLLIGIDLQKDPAIIEAAYNDSLGVTDQFNLNLLHRINNELGGTFEVDRFKHLAFYNGELGRMEIYIVSLCDQTVEVAGERFVFRRGERICTEYSHKYTIEGFAHLAAQAGLTLRKVWTDDRKLFGVLHFAALD